MFDRNKRDANEASDTYTDSVAVKEVKSEMPLRSAHEAAVIGPSIQINGDLSGEEDLVIQGKVNGTIQLREKSLTVGNQGQVDANVLAHSIIVEGKVNGDLYGSDRVCIRKTGDVNGNIISPKVSLDEGCRFKGSIDMDQEVIKKAFVKPDVASSVAKPEVSSSKPKTEESVKPAKVEQPVSAGNGVKAGSSG
jgi:cytoskeletal protein CcmA (bactofilin family)